jgi:tRNA threonylcarbamoyladenosine biosynthesis protein TsaB
VILALDTSGLELLVALVENGELVAGRAVAGSRHQDRVIEMVAEIGDGKLDQLDAVAVSCGPGSHTGLRVGLATASGIAFARRLPIYPLSSLAVAAQRAAAQAPRLLALVAAGRGKVYAQLFDRTSGGYRAAGERRLESLHDLALEGAPAAAEPALLEQLGAAPSGRTGVEALTAAVAEAVRVGGAVNYDQLRGDYGDF